jgi:hypothetical protein
MRPRKAIAFNVYLTPPGDQIPYCCQIKRAETAFSSPTGTSLSRSSSMSTLFTAGTFPTSQVGCGGGPGCATGGSGAFSSPGFDSGSVVSYNGANSILISTSASNNGWGDLDNGASGRCSRTLNVGDAADRVCGCRLYDLSSSQDRSTRCLIETGSQLRGRLRRGPLSGRRTPNIFRTAQVKPNSAESKNPPSSIAQVGTALEREEANIRVTMPTVTGVRGINLVCAVLATSDHIRIFHPFETG